LRKLINTRYKKRGYELMDFNPFCIRARLTPLTSIRPSRSKLKNVCPFRDEHLSAEMPYTGIQKGLKSKTKFTAPLLIAEEKKLLGK